MKTATSPWTTTPPTTSGWYHYRGAFLGGCLETPVFVYVALHERRVQILDGLIGHAGEWHPLTDFEGEWSGPMVVPQ